MNPIEEVRNVLDQFQCGLILLSHGHFEWKIPTDGRPLQVWLSEDTERCDHQVCHGNINTFGTHLCDDGFIIVADVKTDQAEVEWMSFNC